MRKISRGKSDRSYGIEVARMSGLPLDLIENAKVFMNKLDESDDIFKDNNKIIKSSIDDLNKIKIDELKNKVNLININELTPLEAINILNKLIDNIKEIWWKS